MTPPAAASAARRWPRGATPLVAAGLATAVAAWFLTGALVTRTVAGRLPPLPDLSGLPARVAQSLADADTAARREATPAAVGELALVYHASLRTAEALAAYDLAASLAPAEWRWQYYPGLLLEERGEHAAAREAFARVAPSAPAYALAQFHLAELAFKAGRHDDAEAAYHRARTAPVTLPSTGSTGLPPLQTLPLAAHADFGLARVRLDRGDREAARTQLTSIVSAYPAFGSAQSVLMQLGNAGAPGPGRAYAPPADPWLDDVIGRSWHSDLLLKHAALAARSDDPVRRYWLARRALEASPDGLDVLLEMASALQARGEHAEALDFLRRAETVAPDNHHTWVEQGRSLTALGRLDEAEAVLRRAIRFRDASAEFNLGNVLEQLDRWDEARLHYDRALAINPFHTGALTNLGIGFSRRGQPEKSVPYYRRAIEIEPGEAGHHTNLSAALGATGRLAEALAATEAAIKLNPASADAHSNRGIALIQLGRRDEARAAFETALRLAPTHESARRNLAAITRPY